MLFGSRARGNSRRDFDYDVAVFVKYLDNRKRVDHAITDAAYRHIIAGIHIRPVSVPDDLENTSAALLARNIARDGVVIS